MPSKRVLINEFYIPEFKYWSDKICIQAEVSCVAFNMMKINLSQTFLIFYEYLNNPSA